MTSNIGSPIIQENLMDLTDNNRIDVLEHTKTQVFDLLKKTIRPELLNRIDEVIMFTPLTKSEIEDIVRLHFNLITQIIGNKGIKLEITPKAVEWLGRISYDPQFGARPVKRNIQRYILNDLSKSILSNSVVPERPIVVDTDSNGLTFTN